jgi:hypothetical protein
MTITQREIGAYLKAVQAIALGVREAGPMGIGAGILYIPLMGLMSADTFNGIIRKLVEAGLVARSNDLLTWTGPEAL